MTHRPLRTTWGPSSWSPDGSRLLLSRLVDGQGDLFELDLSDGTEQRLTSGPTSDASGSYSPDGAMIAFYAEGPDRSDIAVIQRDGSGRRILTRSPGRHYYPNWSADGEWITFSTMHESGDLDLRAVRVATGVEVELLATPEDERESSWGGHSQLKSGSVNEASGTRSLEASASPGNE